MPTAPAVIATAASTSSGTSHSFTAPGGGVANDSYILFVSYAYTSAQLSGDPANGPSDDVDNDWDRLLNTNGSGDLVITVTEMWRARVGEVSGIDFTTPFSAEAAAVVLLIDHHHDPFTDFGTNSAVDNPGGDETIHTGLTTLPSSQPRLFIDVTLGGIKAGTSAPSVPAGYTSAGSAISGSVNGGGSFSYQSLAIAGYRRETGNTSSEGPNDWSWPEVEADPVASFANIYFVGVRYFDYFIEAESGPYWGMTAGVPA